MHSRTVVAFFAFSLSFSGCYSAHELTRDKVVPGEQYDIVTVTTVSGEHYVLKQLSGGDRGVLQDSTVVGVAEEGKPVRIPLSQVRSIQVSRYNPGTTSLVLLLGVPVGLFALAGIAVAIGGGLW
jgi:hypothetical protein